jgi:hypothetical protein
MSQSAYRSRKPRPWYRKITRAQIGWVFVGLLMLVLIAFGWQATRASSALRLAANQAQVLQNQIVAGDDEAAKTTMASLTESAGRAKGATDGILWRLGAKVPYFGKNVSAVQDVSVAIDTIAREALPPVVNLSSKINLNTYSPHDGKVDIKAIEEIGPSVSHASKAIARANEKIRGIDAGSLIVPLRGPVSSIQAKVGEARNASKSATLAARLLPSMLGKNETRRYLLLIQSNAEIRATGGISGSYAILTAKKGKLSMGFQGAIQDLQPFAKPVIPMTKDEKDVFSSTLVTDLRNANFTPDFPRTAQITRAMVKKGLNEDVDGVISVDPVAMSFILAGTGPVKLKKGAVLTQENAVEVLLNAVYRFYPNAEQQNDTFEDAARRIFNVVKSGRGESRLVISGMVKGASENRILLWSSHKDEQRQIAPSDLSGAFLGKDGKTPRVGLYFNDAAATKMEYYLDYSTRVTASRCLEDDVQELTSTTQVTSNAPSDAKKLPKTVTGDGKFTPRGTMSLYLNFYSPYGGGFTEVRVNNKRQTVYGDSYKGRNVTRVVLRVKPGETISVTTAMISGPHQPGDVVFSTTPGIHSARNDVVTPSACK